MSDIVERLRRGHHNADLITVGGVTHDGRCLVAADEITRLRADLAQLEQESDAEIALLRDYLASAERHRVEEMEERHRLAREVIRLRADLAAAQEREQRMREALEPFAQFADAHVDEEGWSAGRMGERICDWFGPSEFRDARAALSAMRGEP